jgi:hypothetical protein
MIKTKRLNTLFLNLVLVLLFSFLMTGCGKKEDSTTKEDTDKKEDANLEDITEGTPIHYEMEATGEMQGSWDVYVKGKKVMAKMKYSASGKEISSQMWMNEDAMYILSDMGGKKMGMKMDPKKYLEESAQKKDFNALTFKDGCKDCEKIGEEEVIGYKCTIYQDKSGIKYSIYKDKVPLKIVMPKTTIQAKKLEVNVKLADDMFTPPKDVEFVEMDKMMEGFKDMKDSKDMKEKVKDMEDLMKKYKK